jgi:uncharacterized cupredoxin-like copper-binding protein
MTKKHHLASSFIVIVCMAFSTATFAGGQHGHDHGAGAHGTEESTIGKPGLTSKVTRTVKVSMNDKMRFEPASIRVKQGETVRFIVSNAGRIKHEMNLGTEKELLEHLAVMKKFPDMEHAEPNKVTIAPGQQGEIVWQFTKAGPVNFACLIPGHYEAGMRGKVQVSKK